MRGNNLHTPSGVPEFHGYVADRPFNGSRSYNDGDARHLLTETAATNLEITANTLEAAFVTLTADDEVAA